MTPPPFTMVAPLAGADGYGHSAEQLWLHATALGADIAFVAHDWQQPEHTDKRLLDALQDYRDQDRMLSVIYFLPFAFGRPEFRAPVTLGMTMFETDAIPPFWVPGCNQTDGLIVPSEHCRRAFQHAVDVPVRVAPLGVDTAVYNPGLTPLKGYGDFWFLMSGLLHYRKGVEFAVRAFREEFHPKEPAKLLLKTHGRSEGSVGFLDAGSESLDDPRIIVMDSFFGRDEMVQLYRNADCYVACSRGEASGLTPRESMACGTPAIITDWGGLEEIANPDWAYVTGIEGLEPAPLDCTSYGAGVAGHLPIGNFCIPSVSEIRAAMRTAFEDREANREMGERAAEAMKAWSWEACARQWLAVIDELWLASP